VLGHKKEESNKFLRVKGKANERKEEV